MALLPKLALLVLRPMAGDFLAESVEKAVFLLHDHLVDPSQRLPKALASAQQRAWRCLEITLAGESLWSRLGSSEDRALREQIRMFLAVAPLPDLTGKSAFREECLRELRAARKSDLLQTGRLQAGDLRAGWLALKRYGDGAAQVDAEWQVLAEMAAVVKQAGHTNLAQLLTLRPPQGPAVLVLAARYFFRRAVESDEALFRCVALQKWEQLQATQMQGLSALDLALAEHGSRLEAALSDLHGLALDLRDEQRLQGGQIRDVYQQVLKLQEKFDLAHQQLRPGASLSIRGDAELALVKDLLKRYRELPEQERRERPALLNALSKLQVGTGNFDAAQKGFQAVAQMVATPRSRAQACRNAYQAALEKHDWNTALTELMRAVKLDPQQCSLFPMGKYEPRQILGAGGFGVAFLCVHRDLKQQVVVKALLSENLDSTMTDLLNEPRLLGQLQHPAIIRVTDCGYIDRANRGRPYFVMDYFPGATLEEQTREQALSVADLLEVARQMAEGLQKAHQLGVLHRDVKPANVLVHHDERGWQVKLIDFGLALKREVIKNTLDNPSTQTVGRPSIAGTLEFAAPEQMGLHSAKVDTYSDVYGFGKTCCSALFRKTDPKAKDWKALDNAALQELLDDCTEAEPAKRPKDFTAVLQRLAQVFPTVYPAPAAPPTEKGRAAGDTQSVSAQAGRRTMPDTRAMQPGERNPDPKPKPPTVRPPQPTPTPSGGVAPSERLHLIRLRDLLKRLVQSQGAAANAKRRPWVIGIILGVIVGGMGAGVLGGILVGYNDHLWSKYERDFPRPYSLDYEPLPQPQFVDHNKFKRTDGTIDWDRVDEAQKKAEEPLRKAEEKRQKDDKEFQTRDRQYEKDRQEYITRKRYSEATIFLLLSFLFIVLFPTPFALLLGWKKIQLTTAQADVKSLKDKIKQEYPDAVRDHGGTAILNSRSAVEEFVAILDTAAPANPAAAPTFPTVTPVQKKGSKA